VVFIRYFAKILVLIVFLTSCANITEANKAEFEVLCYDYGYLSKSSQFKKCVKRQNIIARYENKNWLGLSFMR
jgi:hypothetical protein